MSQAKPDRPLKAKEYAYKVSAVTGPMDFLGEDNDGVISGVCSRPALKEGGEAAFADDQLCSNECFWKVTYTALFVCVVLAINKSFRRVTVRTQKCASSIKVVVRSMNNIWRRTHLANEGLA